MSKTCMYCVAEISPKHDAKQERYCHVLFNVKDASFKLNINNKTAFYNCLSLSFHSFKQLRL